MRVVQSKLVTIRPRSHEIPEHYLDDLVQDPIVHHGEMAHCPFNDRMKFSLPQCFLQPIDSPYLLHFARA